MKVFSIVFLALMASTSVLAQGSSSGPFGLGSLIQRLSDAAEQVGGSVSQATDYTGDVAGQLIDGGLSIADQFGNLIDEAFPDNAATNLLDQAREAAHSAGDQLKTLTGQTTQALDDVTGQATSLVQQSLSLVPSSS